MMTTKLVHYILDEAYFVYIDSYYVYILQFFGQGKKHIFP